MKLKQMKVLTSEPETGVIYLEGINQTHGRVKGHFLSKVPPAPDGSGGCEYIYPYEGTKCLVAEVNGVNFILGFYTSSTIISKSDRGFSEDMSTGGGTGSYRAETNAHNFLELGVNGLVSLVASAWSALYLDQFTQSLQTKIKRLFSVFGGGFLKWDTDNENNSEFELVINKQFDPYTDARDLLGTPDLRQDDFPKYADKFIMRISHEQDHVVEMETRQDIDEDNIGDTIVRTTYGKAENSSHKHEYLKDVDDRVVNKKLLEDGFLERKNYQAGDSYIEESISNTGEVCLDVNGKTQINIKPDGAVYIEATDQKIFIGTDESPNEYHSLLTAEFLKVFNAHVHAGNMGVTTSTAMYPYPTPTTVTVPGQEERLDQSLQVVSPAPVPNLKIHTSRLRGN